jgi:hypothetical protein
VSRKLSASKKLELIQAAVYSAGNELTADQVLVLIASFFPADTGARINPAMYTELLNLVTPQRPRRKRLR